MLLTTTLSLHNSGRYLQVGCAKSDFAYLPGDVRAECVDVVSTNADHPPHRHSTYKQTFPNLAKFLQERHRVTLESGQPAPSYTFDVISVTLRLNTTTEDERIMSDLLQTLLAPGGVLLLHNVKPSYSFEAANTTTYTGEDSIYYMGYNLQVSVVLYTMVVACSKIALWSVRCVADDAAHSNLHRYGQRHCRFRWV